MLGEPALELLQTSRGDGADLLDDRDWLRSALVRWGMPGADVDVAELKRLREIMRRVVEILDAGRLPTDADLEQFNTFIARVPVVARIERYGDGYVLDMEPQATGSDRVLRELAGW